MTASCLSISFEYPSIAKRLFITFSSFCRKRCPHCNKTKALLGSDEFKDVDILIRDLDVITEPSGPCLAKALADKTGQTSVPNVFIDGKHFGGNSDLQEAYAKGDLKLA